MNLRKSKKKTHFQEHRGTSTFLLDGFKTTGDVYLRPKGILDDIGISKAELNETRVFETYREGDWDLV